MNLPLDPVTSRGKQRTGGAESHTDHALKNHLAIVIGYTELLIAGTSASDPRYEDLLEIQRAATTALSLIRERDA